MEQFLVDVWNSKKYQEFKHTNPLAAKLMFDYYRDGYATTMKYYKDYREGLIKANAGRWGDGAVFASIPAVVLDWLRWEYGREPSKEELFEYIKKHKEFQVKEL